MGPLGYPELIVIFLMLVALAIPVIIVFGIIWYFVRRKKAQKTVQTQMNDDQTGSDH